MIQYLLKIKNPDNEEIVASVLRPICEGDLLTDDVVRDNLSKLGLLKDIGENEVFEAVSQDLLEDETYSKHMKTETGS